MVNPDRGCHTGPGLRGINPELPRCGRVFTQGKPERRDVIDQPQNGHTPASDVVEQAHASLHGETVTVHEVVEALGTTSYTPLLLMPALAVISPLSGLPGFTTVCGILIAAVALQQMMGRERLWLPDWVQRRSVGTDRVRKVTGWFRKPAKWLDLVTRQRLGILVGPPLVLIPQGLVLVLGAAMPLLELVPFTSSIMGVVITILVMGMFTGDGLLVLGGLVAAAGLPVALSMMI